MYILYSFLLALGLIAGLPFWLYQIVRHGKYMRGFGERMGRVPQRLRQPAQPTIWIHAVSVGEVLAITQLVQQLKLALPSHRIVVSTTTDTGQALARKKIGNENVFYVPLDFAFSVRPYLKEFQPELVMLAETEFWPNFLRLAHASGAAVAVVNGRISDRSFPGYKRWRLIFARVLQNVDLLLAQTDEDRRRLVAIGAREATVQVSGNLKFDVPISHSAEIVTRLHENFATANSGPVIVAGSTVDVEEEGMLLSAFRNVLTEHPHAVLVLAPRHPERFDEVATLLDKCGVKYWRRSTWQQQPIVSGIFLLDSIGELGAVYSLADVAFVGGSLVPRGGHNIIEPALFGVATIVGNYTDNFRDIVTLFQSNDAVRKVGPAELPLVLRQLLNNPEERAALGRRARGTLESQMGATQRTVDALINLLSRPRSTVDAS